MGYILHLFNKKKQLISLLIAGLQEAILHFGGSKRDFGLILLEFIRFSRDKCKKWCTISDCFCEIQLLKNELLLIFIELIALELA